MPLLKYKTIIRDPVHGYIHLTDIEREIINTRIFLRLQFVKQSPTAFLTYPAHNVDRFIHSLGTMELSSRVFIAAFANSQESVIDKFLQIAASSLKISEEKKIIENIVQLARLSGLLHDLGHLPFSHLGEGAIKSFTTSLYGNDKDFKKFTKDGNLPALHEFATYKLIKQNQELVKKFTGNNKVYLKWLLEVFAPKPTGIFKTIHDIISGEIDVDRADYLIRDGKTSGIGFGEYDLMRLVESMVFFKDNEDNFLIVPTTAALSSAEAFFIERYKIYKWLCYHQHVVLTDTTLSYIIRVLIQWSMDKTHPLHKVLSLQEFHFSNYISDGTPFDDLYLWNKLRDVFKYVQKIIHEKKYAKWEDDLLFIDVLLRIILFREKHARAVFKNPSEYKVFDDKLRSGFKTDKVPHQEYLPKLPILNIYATNIAGSYPIPEDKRLDKILSEDDNQFILETERTTFRPYAYTIKEVEHTIQGEEAHTLMEREYVSKFFLVNKNTGEKSPISEISQVVKHLLYAWKNDMQLFVYIARFKKPKKEDWTVIVDKARDNVYTHIKNIWINGDFKT